MLLFDKGTRRNKTLITVYTEENDYKYIKAEIIISEGKTWLIMKEYLLEYDELKEIVEYMEGLKEE